MKDRKCLLSTMGLMNKWTQNLWQNTQNVHSSKLNRAPAQSWSSGHRFSSLTWKLPAIYTHHQRKNLFSLIECHCSTVVGQHQINSTVFICMLVRGNFLFLFVYILVLWNNFKDRERRENKLQQVRQKWRSRINWRKEKIGFKYFVWNFKNTVLNVNKNITILRINVFKDAKSIIKKNNIYLMSTEIGRISLFYG